MVTIQSAESNRAVLRYIAESVWGTTPASGVTKTMRIKSSSIVASKETQMSQELRADRMVPSIIEVGASTGGDVEFELSAGSQDDFFKQFLLSAWTLDMNFWLVRGSSVTVTANNTITVTGADWTDWVVSGQYVKLEGFLTIGNNGYWLTTAVAYTSGNTVITISGTPLVAEAGSAYTKIMDASDVILKSTATAIVATNKINGGGANSFAGKTLKVGQKIFIEGLGKETASIQMEATNPTEGDEFSLNDGVSLVPFEIRTDSTAVAAGNVHVALSNTQATLADNIVAAVNDQFRKEKIRMTAAAVAGTKESGTVTFATTAEIGDTVTVDDGVSGPITFIFVASGATGLLQVNIGVSATESATNLEAKIDAHTSLNVTSTSLAGVITIVNDNYTGGAITNPIDGGGDITFVNFSGGTDPTVLIKNHRNTGGVITESLACLTAGSFSGGDATLIGVKTIASLPDDDSIVVAETITNNANGGSLTVVIKGSHIRNPGVVSEITKQSVSAETGFTDVEKYFSHDGLRVGSMSLSVSAGEICTGKVSFMGRQTVPRSATVLGDTPYTVMDTTNTEVLNATANVGSILKDGVALTTAITKIDLELDASLREQKAVGSRFPAGIGYGRFSLKGSFEAYFQNFDLWNAFLNHTTTSLAFQFEDLDHNYYSYTLPAIKLTADPVAPSGIDTDVMEPIEFSAQRDASLNTMFMVDRFSSIYPASAA